MNALSTTTEYLTSNSILKSPLISYGTIGIAHSRFTQSNHKSSRFTKKRGIILTQEGVWGDGAFLLLQSDVHKQKTRNKFEKIVLLVGGIRSATTGRSRFMKDRNVIVTQ